MAFYSAIAFLALHFLLNGLLLADQPDNHKSPISSRLLKQHLEVLGSDRMEGRGTGSYAERSAAAYIAQMLKNSGVAPAAGRDSYFQPIPMHGNRILPSSKLLLFRNNEVDSLELREEYLVDDSAGNIYLATPLEMVFAGYGIAAPEFDYNDYQYIDVRGKIVVYLEGEPYSEDEQYFNGLTRSIYAYPEAKQRIAQAQGAIGCILLTGVTQDSRWSEWQREYSFEEVTLAYSVANILSLIMPPSTAEKLLRGSPQNLAGLAELHRRNQIYSFELPGKLSFRGKFTRRDFIAQNVAGKITGSDSKLRDRWLLVSAHYDHLGIGAPVAGDSLYNGVFDNAAGVAGALEIARHLALNPPRSSVLFLFVTGEERGLLGSGYYADHPLVPLYKTNANINIDGLSMFDTMNEIIAIGADMSDLQRLLEESALAFGMRAVKLPAREQFFLELFARSDQISFARAGVPAMLTVEGLNYRHTGREAGIARLRNWTRHIYHSPADDLSQPINYEAMAQHIDLLLHLCNSVGNRDREIRWNVDAPFRAERLRTRAEKR